jgi:hypothetical protein
MDKSPRAWRCGRRRQDGSRCHRVLAWVTQIGEGRWHLAARGAGAQLERMTVPDGLTVLVGADRWSLSCHPRCGAFYSFTDARMRQILSRGQDVILADELTPASRV